MDRKNKIQSINDFAAGLSIDKVKAKSDIRYDKMTLAELHHATELGNEEQWNNFDELIKSLPKADSDFLIDLFEDNPKRKSIRSLKGVDIIEYHDQAITPRIHSCFYYPKVGKIKQVWLFNMPIIDYYLLHWTELQQIQHILWRQNIGESEEKDSERLQAILVDVSLRSRRQDFVMDGLLHTRFFYKDGKGVKEMQPQKIEGGTMRMGNRQITFKDYSN